MNITLFTIDESCTELIQVKSAHISMFEKDMSTKIHFINREEQLKLIDTLIAQYVLFKCQGNSIILLQDTQQRVGFRFDS